VVYNRSIGAKPAIALFAALAFLFFQFKVSLKIASDNFAGEWAVTSNPSRISRCFTGCFAKSGKKIGAAN